jgi:hypothetical protein
MRRIWVTATPITDAVTAAAGAAGATEIIVVADGYPRALTAAGITTPGFHQIPAPPVPVTEANRQTIMDRAATALAANTAYLAVGSPSNAQNLAQIRMLTRECTSLIRLALNLLDSTDGT